MKILLISPKFKPMGLESFVSGYTIGSGILSVAAAARDAGHEVAVELGNEENILTLLKTHSPDMVGITCLTVSYPVAKTMITMIKEYNPDILTIIGGHHATFMTEEIFSECDVDYVLRGEGESAFPLLLHHIESGNKYPLIEGVAFKREGKIFNKHSFTLLQNIDSLPKITTDLVPGEIHSFVPQISSSRGCPFRCSFCSISAFYKGRWRKRKPETILDEIDMYASEGHGTFKFDDDNLTVDTTRVREICDNLKERGLDNLKWGCLSRVDSICRDPAMVDEMVDAGCSWMQLGIESGVQEIINTYKKHITLEQVRKAVKIMNDSSVFHTWFSIIGSGNKYDQPKYIEKNINFLKKIKFDLLQISILTPFPGTELYCKLKEENRLLHKNWKRYDCVHCVYQPLYVTPQQIEEYFLRAYRSIYASRGLDLLKMARKGLKSGSIITPEMLFKTTKYGIDIILGRKNLYETLE